MSPLTNFAFARSAGSFEYLNRLRSFVLISRAHLHPDLNRLWKAGHISAKILTVAFARRREFLSQKASVLQFFHEAMLGGMIRL